MARQDLDAVFQQSLGRLPNEAELAFFGRFIDEGHLQPYEVAQFIQASPEAAQTRLPAQAEQFTRALSGQDEEIMRRAGEGLASQFYQQGRPRSSGYTAAYLNAARDLALARQPQIADFYRQGLQGVAGGYNRGAGTLDRGYGLRDLFRQRQWDIEDYYRQQNDYNAALSGQESRNLRGALINAGIGFGMKQIDPDKYSSILGGQGGSGSSGAKGIFSTGAIGAMA